MHQGCGYKTSFAGDEMLMESMVCLGCTEEDARARESHLGLDLDSHHLALCALNGGLAPHIYPDGRVELEGLSARGDLWVAKHDADLLPQLVEHDDGAAALGCIGCDLPHCLAHQSGLCAHCNATTG